MNLLVVFSGFYIQKATVSPVYITFVIGSYMLFLLFIYKSSFKNDKLVNIAFFGITYFLITQIYVKGEINTTGNVIISILYFIIVIQGLHFFNYADTVSMSRRFINFSIAILILECIYRMNNPEYYFNYKDFSFWEQGFYIYKINSFMFQDSNFVGIFIISLFFFTVYLKTCHNQKFNIQLILLAILCFFTFSRAAWISLVFCYIIILFKNKRLYMKKVLIFSCMVLGSIFLFYIVKIDSSGLSKLKIFQLAFKFLKTGSYKHILLGVGFGRAKEYIGIGAHNFIITYLIESGIIGLLFIVIFWSYINVKTKYKASYVMFPFLICGMSLAGHAIPYLYCIYAIIFTLEKYNAYSNYHKEVHKHE
ncbi:O-antigen ligase family protein [Defluviitalea raffinosedens]|uniref:O-antigen ligase family protein n=1 Tax=Defluviitalea raffinosedens TaxID=1450156 RepID=UPI00131B1C9B|nr:O-antigen ligase family protein [Defluviitalea raffinosedens]